MKINKQLFEDVLSGKRTGTFILRFGDKVNSVYLSRNTYLNKDKYPYRLTIDGVITSYTEDGLMLYKGVMTDVDIMDFVESDK